MGFDRFAPVRKNLFLEFGLPLVTVIMRESVVNESWSLFLFVETFRSFLAETFSSLKHFGHLSHNCIKTRHKSVF